MQLTVCVPVYNAARFVEDTLRHVAAQTCRDFRVLVSVDAGDDSSESVCRHFESDPRFEVVVQSHRLGWVGNVNALIARVDTPFFCIMPHDDLPEPRYLEAMLDLLEREPAAACAYSDIRGFGAQQNVVGQQEVRGDRLQRVLDVILNHYDSVPFRGVVRRRDGNDRPYLPAVIPGGFAADTAWLVPLALRGELRRVPEPLYRKFYDPATVHAGWTSWPRPDLVRLHATMIAASVQLALEELNDAVEREEVLTAGLLRAAGIARGGGPGAPRGALESATAVAIFTEATRDLGLVADPAAVLARTRIDVLQNAIPAHLPEPSPQLPRLSLRRWITRRLRRVLQAVKRRLYNRIRR